MCYMISGCQRFIHIRIRCRALELYSIPVMSNCQPQIRRIVLKKRLEMGEVKPLGHNYQLLESTIHNMLGTQLQEDDLIFSTLDGRPLRPNTVTRAWSMLASRCGLKGIRLHDARHTHASLMLKQGVYPKIVQERLGHATIAVTLDTYSHISPGLQQAAAEGFDRMVLPRREKEAVENL